MKFSERNNQGSGGFVSELVKLNLQTTEEYGGDTEKTVTGVIKVVSRGNEW